MAFEMKNFMVFKKIVLPKTQEEKECCVEIDEEISKVLTASSQASLSSVEVGEGEISYTAELDNCVIFATSDGKIGSSNSICEFSGKIENAEIKSGDKAILSLSVKDVKIGFENGNAILKITIEECVELLSQKEVRSIDCEDDDVCTKKGGLVLERFVGSAKSDCTTEEEVVARSNVKKIVSLEPSIVIKSVDCENGVVTVAGDTISRLVYLTEEDKFEVTYVNASFKDEIEVEACEQNMKAVCKPNIKRRNCVAEVLESDKGTKISVNTPFMLEVFVFGSQEVDTIEDMYSIRNEIKMTSDSFDMTKVCQNQVLESKIDGSLTLGDDKPRVDKIIFSGGDSINVTNAYVSNKELFVEGIAKTTVVYLNDDEATLNSVEVEIPFVLSEKTSAGDNALVCADAIIYDADVNVKRGRDLYFDAKVKANARVCEDEYSATITSAERGENYGEKDYAMQYVFGKEGEGLWEIAKRYKVKEEQLISQNQDVTFPLIQDTGFILFFQKLM